VIREYGGDPDHPIGAMTFEAAFANLYDEDLLLLRTLTHDRYVVALENNGWAGANAELASKLSQNGGRFLSVYVGGNGSSRIVQAIDDARMADFDPISAPRSANAEGYPPWWTDGMFNIFSMTTDMLEAMTQQTGLVLRREWFEQEMPTYRIPVP
jgi:hypothetical protein